MAEKRSDSDSSKSISKTTKTQSKSGQLDKQRTSTPGNIAGTTLYDTKPSSGRAFGQSRDAVLSRSAFNAGHNYSRRSAYTHRSSHGRLNQSTVKSPQSLQSTLATRRRCGPTSFTSVDDEITNASAEAFRHTFNNTPRLDPRQTPNSAAYKPGYGRLSPPREPADEGDFSDSATLAEIAEDDEVMEKLERVEQEEKDELREHSGEEEPRTLARVMTVEGNEALVKINVKLDKESSLDDIIVTANLSLSMGLRFDKTLWHTSGTEIKEDLKCLVRKRLQLQIKEATEEMEFGRKGSEEHWEL